MQARDAVILAVGALVVAGATAYAGLAAPSKESYVLAYALQTTTVPLQPTGSGDLLGSFKLDVDVPVSSANVTLVHVEGSVTATALPPTATLHATLKAPNGTTLTKDASASAGATSMAVVFDAPVASPPPNATGDYDAAASARAALAPASTQGQGAWHLTLQVSTGAPSAVPFGVAASARFVAWSGDARPAVAPVQK